MKNFLFLILLSFSSLAISSVTNTENILQSLNSDIKDNSILIEKLNASFKEKNINIFYFQWKSMLNKKCSWVKNNINTELYGQEDKFSDQFCVIEEQNSFISKLILLLEKYDIKITYDYDVNKYQIKLITNIQHNVYFNRLTETFSDIFCHSFYSSNEDNYCVKNFMLTQFIPEDYDFKIIQDKSYLFNSPNNNDNSKMYLIKGDEVSLLQYKDDFYEIEYTTKSNKIIKKWLHCSAIDACVSSD